MKVKQFLHDPNVWCQGSMAKDREGNTVASTDASACHWCLLGAVNKCYPETLDRRAVIKKLSEVITEESPETPSVLEFGNVVKFNDDPGRQFADIVEILEKADV